MTTKSITVEKTFGSGDNSKTVNKAGTCVVAETAEDILSLLQEDATSPVGKDATETEIKRQRNRVIDYFNYASDLKARAKLTAALNSENVDPDKANEKALEQFNKARLANGKAAVDMDKFLLIMGS
jgi:hypothetical protein